MRRSRIAWSNTVTVLCHPFDGHLDLLRSNMLDLFR